MAVDNITVNLETPGSQEWVEVPDAGGTPFLDVQGDGNNLTTGSSGNQHGDFSFDSLPGSPTSINSANLYIYCNPGTETINVDVWDDDGAAWINAAAAAEGTGDSLHGPYDISAVLDTVNNVANALVRINSKNIGKWDGSQSADYLYITVDYEVGGQSLSETLEDFTTLSDSQYKSQSTLYDESAAMSEFLAKSASRLFAEVTTIVGYWSYSKFTVLYQDLFDAITTTDASLRGIFQSIYASLSVVSTDSKSYALPVAESTTLSDFIVQGLQWLLYESTTLLDFDIPFGMTRYDAEATSLFDDSDTVTQFYRVLFDVTTLTDYVDIVTTVILNILQAVNIPDYLRTISAYTSSLVDTTTLSDYIFSGMYSLIEQSISLSDYWTYAFSTTLPLLDAISTSDYYTLLYSALKVEAITMPDYISRVWTAISVGVETLDISDYVSIAKSVLVDFLEAINLLDYFIRVSSWYHVTPETITLLDFLSSAWTAYTDTLDTLGITEYWDYDLISFLFQTLVDAVNVGEYLTYQSTIARAIIESIAVVEALLLTVSKLYTDPLTLGDTLNYVSTWERALVEVPSMNDLIDIVRTMARVYTDQMTLLDYVDAIGAGQLFKAVTEALALSHYLQFSIEHYLYDTFTLVDSALERLIEIVKRFIRLRFVG